MTCLALTWIQVSQMHKQETARIIAEFKIRATEVSAGLEHRLLSKEGANKQVISSQADSLIKISRIWADFFPANTSNQPI